MTSFSVVTYVRTMSTRRRYVTMALLLSLFLVIVLASINNYSASHVVPASPLPLKQDACKIVDIKTVDTSANFDCVDFYTWKGKTPICIYDTSSDAWVSKSLKETGKWESYMTNKLQEFLASDPDLHLIDVGANLGVFTLTAAANGRTVVSVEPLWDNAVRLSKSIKLGHFEDQVTIVNNAVSNGYLKATFFRPFENAGGSHIITLSETDNRKDTVDTILMDNLLEVVTFKKAVMKMDIEGHEIWALEGAHRLFEEVDIRYLFIEWPGISKTSAVQGLVDFLTRRNYLAYTISGSRLRMYGWPFNHAWPENVMWVKQV
ncbi:uncharacterized protein LOC135500641 [Lineus longissimus]|uniref:uncharacterized protein LOC135500641 n=1 Tax=Lineus longissimus TaxID=88925 RepID=UPI00315D0FB3